MVLRAAEQAGLAGGEQMGHQRVADRVSGPPLTVHRCHGHPAQLDPAITLLPHGPCDWRAGLFVDGEDHRITDQARTEFRPVLLRHLEADGALNTPIGSWLTPMAKLYLSCTRWGRGAWPPMGQRNAKVSGRSAGTIGV